MKKLRLALLVGLALTVLTGCQIPGQNKKAGLQVVTGETPSSLFLDGQYIEKSPYVNKALQPGEYTLRIEPDNSKLLPHDVNINLRPGLLTVVTWQPGERPELNAGVTYEMEPIDSKQAALQFLTIPDEAIITLTGQPKQFAPVTLELTEGEYEFEVSLPAYRTQRHTVRLTKGFKTKVAVTLAKGSDTPSATTTTTASTSASLDARTATAAAQLTTTSTATTSAVITSGPRVKILPTNFRLAGTEGLRVRAAATSTAREVGFAPTGSIYRYANKTENGWLAIEFQGEVGWVSTQFSQLIQP